MNPFVNPKKRSITLPKGCKDLADVLKHSEDKTGMADIDFGTANCVTAMKTRDPAVAARKFICLLLFQAQKDNVTELVIGVNSSDGNTPIREKINDAWHDSWSFPAQVRPHVIGELARMANILAGILAGQMPCEGILNLSFGKVRLKWTVAMAGAEGECKLARTKD